MNPHYQAFFRMIKTGRYFHFGYKPLRKSYGYIGNTVQQYIALLSAPRKKINRIYFYIADYKPISFTALDYTDSTCYSVS